MNYTVHGILQARILAWVAFPLSRGSSQPRDRTHVSRHCGRILYQLSYKRSQSVPVQKVYFPNAFHRCPDRCSLSGFSPTPCSAFFFLTDPHSVFMEAVYSVVCFLGDLASLLPPGRYVHLEGPHLEGTKSMPGLFNFTFSHTSKSVLHKGGVGPLQQEAWIWKELGVG